MPADADDQPMPADAGQTRSPGLPTGKQRRGIAHHIAHTVRDSAPARYHTPYRAPYARYGVRSCSGAPEARYTLKNSTFPHPRDCAATALPLTAFRVSEGALRWI